MGHSNPTQCYQGGGWGHKAVECHSLENFHWGGCEQSSSQGSNPRNSSKPVSKSINGVAGSGIEEYYNPDPILQIIGDINETPVHVDGVQCTTLIDSGAQMSAITTSFAKQLGLKVNSLEKFTNVEGSVWGSKYHILDM